MWTLPKRDLKLRLTLQIAGVAVLCLLIALTCLLIAADRSMRQRIGATAEIAAKGLVLQQERLDWIKGLPLDFPDLQIVAVPLIEPGLCIGYRDDGALQQRFCGGTPPDVAAPALFAAFYQSLFDPGREAARPIRFHGKSLGEAVVWADPAAVTAQAWQGIGPVLAVMAGTLTLLCLLVYAALARALRPTRIIAAGLERIAAHDLSTRLPPFDLAELSAIRDVFNSLAADLERTLDERKALTRKLIDVQDEERRHLARELHDAFGQSLTAIRALAAALGPAPESASIERIAAEMMETVRGTLVRLRPPDVDEFGLAASLEALVAGWNAHAGRRTRFEVSLDATVETIPAAIGTSLYRIAQEAITNAAKHAEATRVVLDLRAGSDTILLTVVDDGKAHDPDETPRSGLGILGMRERVAALGGVLVLKREGGTTLSVTIPLGVPSRHAA